jgi:hypothetical protein
MPVAVLEQLQQLELDVMGQQQQQQQQQVLAGAATS